MTPVSVTQHTSMAVLSVPPRRYREMVRRYRIRHVRDGKLIVVLVADWVDAMRHLAAGETEPAEQDATPRVRSVDERLAALGRRRAS